MIAHSKRLYTLNIFPRNKSNSIYLVVLIRLWVSRDTIYFRVYITLQEVPIWKMRFIRIYTYTRTRIYWWNERFTPVTPIYIYTIFIYLRTDRFISSASFTLLLLLYIRAIFVIWTEYPRGATHYCNIFHIVSRLCDGCTYTRINDFTGIII